MGHAKDTEGKRRRLPARTLRGLGGGACLRGAQQTGCRIPRAHDVGRRHAAALHRRLDGRCGPLARRAARQRAPAHARGRRNMARRLERRRAARRGRMRGARCARGGHLRRLHVFGPARVSGRMRAHGKRHLRVRRARARLPRAEALPQHASRGRRGVHHRQRRGKRGVRTPCAGPSRREAVG